MKNLVLFLLLLVSSSSFALSIPQLTSPIMDQAGVIPSDKKQELNQKIRDIWKKGTVQISVLIIPSLENEVLEDYSIKVAENWSLGTKEKDNGLLILVAMKEKKIRVEVGNGIEGEITDIDASRVIDVMKSFMRSKNYAGGINAAIDNIVEKIEYNSPENVAKREEEKIQKELARQQREKEKEIAFKKMSYVASIIFSIVAWLFALGAIISKSKKKKEMQERVPQLEESIKRKARVFEIQQNDLKRKKINPQKLEYKRCSDHISSLKDERDSLINEIKSMKNYLGVK